MARRTIPSSFTASSRPGRRVIFYTHNYFDRRPALLVLPRCGQHGEGNDAAVGIVLSRRARYLSEQREACKRSGARASASGCSRRIRIATRWSKCWRGGSIRCRPSPTRRCGRTGRCKAVIRQFFKNATGGHSTRRAMDAPGFAQDDFGFSTRTPDSGN